MRDDYKSIQEACEIFDETDLHFEIPTVTNRYPSALRPPAFDVPPVLTAREWTMLGILAAGAAEEARQIGNSQAARLYESLAHRCDKGAEAERTDARLRGGVKQRSD